MEKFTPLATNFTLPPALTALTNSTSGDTYDIRFSFQCEDFDDLIVVIGDHDNWNNW